MTGRTSCAGPREGGLPRCTVSRDDRSAFRAMTESLKVAVGQLLARRWPLTLPMTAAATRRCQARPLRGLAHHLAEGLEPAARYQVARLRTGARMLVDVKDQVQRPMYFLGEWEPATSSLIRRSAGIGWSFLDIGANAGYFSLLAADAGGASSRVVAVEPNPPLAGLLALNVALNGLGRTIAVRTEACGASAGTATLHVSTAENSGRSTLRAGRLDDIEASAVAVGVMTVDALCAELDFWPDFVKVDAEGWESQIVRGMRHVLTEHPPQVVVLEVSTFGGDEDPRVVIDLMAETSYRPFRIGAGGVLSEVSASNLDGLENLAFLMTAD